MSDVDIRGGCACVGAGVIWEISVPPSQFCYKPKTTLKEKVPVLKKKKKYLMVTINDEHCLRTVSFIVVHRARVQGGLLHWKTQLAQDFTLGKKWPPQWPLSWIPAFTFRLGVIMVKMAVTVIPHSFTSRNWIQLDFFHRKVLLEAGFVFRQRRQKNIGTLSLGFKSLVLLSLVITVIFKPVFTFGCFPLNPFENALVESLSLNRAFPGFSFRLFHYTFLALPNTL